MSMKKIKFCIALLLSTSSICAYAQTDAASLLKAGDQYLSAGKAADAELAYSKVVEQQAKSIPALQGLASIEIYRGNDQKATAYLKEIISVDSSNVEAYKKLASLYSGPRDSTIKVNYLLKGYAQNPTDADVIASLGDIYLNKAKFKEINQLLQPALKADSLNMRLHRLSMLANLGEKKYGDVVRTGKLLLAMGDSSGTVFNAMGRAHFWLLDYQVALKYFLKARDTGITDPSLDYHVARCYRSLKDHKNAVPYLNKVIEAGVSPKMASYYGLLGEAYEGMGKYNDALAAFKKGLDFENNGSLYYNMALVYENRLNDKKNAIANYNLYLKNGKETGKNPKLAAFIKNKVEELKR